MLMANVWLGFSSDHRTTNEWCGSAAAFAGTDCPAQNVDLHRRAAQLRVCASVL